MYYSIKLLLLQTKKFWIPLLSFSMTQTSFVDLFLVTIPQDAMLHVYLDDSIHVNKHPHIMFG